MPLRRHLFSFFFFTPEPWGETDMVVLHFERSPLQAANIEESEVTGKFKGWQHNANYSVSTTVIVQIDTTNVTPKEYSIAPNITYFQTNQAIINIYKQWNVRYLSFSTFQSYYEQREIELLNYIENLINRLNTARREQNKYGEWFINYSLNERHINVSKPLEYEASDWADDSL